MTNFDALIDRAEAQRARSQFKAARALFLKAAAAAPAQGMKAQALQGAADCARLLGDFLGALKDYARALARAPKMDVGFAADLQCGQALAYRASGQPAKALRGLTSALARYRALRDPEGVAFCLWALGGTYRIAGDLKAARSRLLAAEKAYAKLGDGEGYSYVGCALGGVHRMLGLHDAGARYYAGAAQLMRARHDAFGTAYSWCGLGNAARMRGDLKAALALFKRAEKGYAKIGDIVSYAYTLWSLAQTHKLGGDFGPARQALAQAGALFKRTGDGRGQAYVQQASAESEALEGRPRAALKRLRASAKLCKPYAWEARHHRALAALISGRPWDVPGAYAGSGSAFRPQSLPVNWP
jgi:tetratricopeptide (TPR) repeat protein